MFGVCLVMFVVCVECLCLDVIFVLFDFVCYKVVLCQVCEIFLCYIDLVELLLLDEVYLDVIELKSGIELVIDIVCIICMQICEEMNLIVLVGIVLNKFLVKIVLDWCKLDGQFVILLQWVDVFLQLLLVNWVFGVGKVMEGKLVVCGIVICGDLW